MSQIKLDKFFTVKPNISNKNKYFIYIPEERRAIYINKVKE